MEKQTVSKTVSFWNDYIKPLFPERTLEFTVETPFFKGRYVNLDNAATTSAFRSVEEAVQAALVSYGSVHRGTGQKSSITTDLYEQARESIRTFVGASAENYILFTKNTTEAINHAAALFARVPGKVLVSDIEHSSNLLPWLEHNEVMQYKTDDTGVVDFWDVEGIFKKHTNIKLLAITGSSNVTGYKQPLSMLAELAHQYGAKIFIDVCQLIPHAPVVMMPDDDSWHLDFITFSGHKMYAPFGSGVLIGPKEFFDRSLPYQIGGGNLPYITRDLEIKRFSTVQAHDPGTPNALGAIAMAASMHTIDSLNYLKIMEYESALVENAYNQLKKIEGVTLHISKEKMGGLGSVLPFNIAGFNHYLVAEILAREYGIGVRAGSFCTYELLRKMKHLSDDDDRTIAAEVDSGITKNIPGVARASFSLINTEEDVDRFVSAVAEITLRGFAYYAERYIQHQTTGTWRLK